MGNGETTLVMAGAREAHGIVAGLIEQGQRVIASLPEPERMFDPLPVPTRTGGFADAEALGQWIAQNHVTCVIDASHAYDAEISNRVARLCEVRNLRYLRVLRPVWQASDDDRWTQYASLHDAAIDVCTTDRSFSNTGRASLPEYLHFSGEVLFLRQTQTSPDPPPFPFVEYVVGTPPFSQEDEETLFRALGISRLICRNVGGIASISKLLAARRLGIAVSMIERPASPPGMPCVTNVAEALSWEANA